MSKAEEKAMEKYPPHGVLVVPARGGGYYADSHLREGFIEGYHQAEKELIEKGIEFLKDHLEGYDIFGSDIERSVESFKLAMKDE